MICWETSVLWKVLFPNVRACYLCPALSAYWLVQTRGARVPWRLWVQERVAAPQPVRGTPTSTPSGPVSALLSGIRRPADCLSAGCSCWAPSDSSLTRSSSGSAGLNFLGCAYLTAASESNKITKSRNLCCSRVSWEEAAARVQIRLESRYTTEQYLQWSQRAHAAAKPAPFDGPPALWAISSLFIC